MPADRVQPQAATFTAALSSQILLQSPPDNDSGLADAGSVTPIDMTLVA